MKKVFCLVTILLNLLINLNLVLLPRDTILFLLSLIKNDHSRHEFVRATCVKTHVARNRAFREKAEKSKRSIAARERRNIYSPALILGEGCTRLLNSLKPAE